MTAAFRPSDFQKAVCALPAEWSIGLFGGRGSGKTTALMLLLAQHAALYGEHAHSLMVRLTLGGLEQFANDLHDILLLGWPGGVNYHKTNRIFTLSNGATITLGHVDNDKSYRQWQGKSFTLLAVDEFGLYTTNQYVDQLKSNLRSPAGVPLRTLYLGNPNGSLHSYIHRTFVSGKAPWKPFEVNGETFVYAPSTYRDNFAISHADYVRRLEAACAGDAAKLDGWLNNSWATNRGAAFPQLNAEDHLFSATPFRHRVDKRFRPRLAFDYGYTAPAVCLLILEAPGDVGPWRKGTLLCLDERSSVDRSDPTWNKALQYPPSALAEMIHEMCDFWGVHPRGVGDNASSIEGESLLDLFRSRYRIDLQPPTKGRVAGWARVRDRLYATSIGEGPGLLISDRCAGVWATLPMMITDSARPEDILSNGCPDHWADSLRYGVMEREMFAKGGNMTGHF